MLRRVPGICCMGPRISLQTTLSSSVIFFLKELIIWDKKISASKCLPLVPLEPVWIRCSFASLVETISHFLGAAMYSLPVASLAESSSIPLPISRSSASMPRYHRQGQPGKDLTHVRANSSADAFRFLKMAYVLLQVGLDVLGKLKAQPIQKYPPSPAPLDAGEGEVT